MTMTASPSLAYEGEPEATITRGVHFGYWADVCWGLMGVSTAPWWRWTRASADRKARREIRRWKAEVLRETWTVAP